MKEFYASLKREVDTCKEKIASQMDQGSAKEQDMHRLTDLEISERATKKIYAEILKEAQEKINERRVHKSISQALIERINKVLLPYLNEKMVMMRRYELLELKVQLFNIQLGLGNNELRKLAKTSDQVGYLAFTLFSVYALMRFRESRFSAEACDDGKELLCFHTGILPQKHQNGSSGLEFCSTWLWYISPISSSGVFSVLAFGFAAPVSNKYLFLYERR